ncbi:hypothetical protein Tco_0270426 [Tanacetum coccineum]
MVLFEGKKRNVSITLAETKILKKACQFEEPLSPYCEGKVDAGDCVVVGEGCVEVGDDNGVFDEVWIESMGSVDMSGEGVFGISENGSSRCKFVIEVLVSKCLASNNSEVIKRWRFTIHAFKWTFVVDWFGWESVNKIGSCKNTVSPKMDWKIGLKSQSPCNFKELFVFPFNSGILLRANDIESFTEVAMSNPPVETLKITSENVKVGGIVEELVGVLVYWM